MVRTLRGMVKPLPIRTAGMICAVVLITPGTAGAQSLRSDPGALPLPLPASGNMDPKPSPRAPLPPSSPTAMKAPLHPGQTIQPIDLATALRLAGARDLDIATARQRVCESLADLQRARAL
jgi:hypothetical protein